MSTEPKLLPPHTEPVQPGASDATAFIRKQRAVPKRPYKAAEPPPPPDPEPQAKGPDPEPKAPEGGTTEAPTGEAISSAKEFIETYDLLQSFGFSMYSDGMPIEKFQLPQPVKDRAEHHLARGLQGMGNPELPWAVGLAIALAPPAYFSYLTAREHRAAKREEEQAKAANTKRKESGEALHPTIIYDANGNVVRGAAPAKAPMRDQATHTTAAHAAASAEPLPPCQVCGKPVKHKGRKYCGQSCAGAASKGRKRTTQPNNDGTAVS